METNTALVSECTHGESKREREDSDDENREEGEEGNESNDDGDIVDQEEDRRQRHADASRRYRATPQGQIQTQNYDQSTTRKKAKSESAKLTMTRKRELWSTTSKEYHIKMEEEREEWLKTENGKIYKQLLPWHIRDIMNLHLRTRKCTKPTRGNIDKEKLFKNLTSGKCTACEKQLTILDHAEIPKLTEKRRTQLIEQLGITRGESFYLVKCQRCILNEKSN